MVEGGKSNRTKQDNKPSAKPPIPIEKKEDKELVLNIIKVGEEIATLRGRPLLLLFYSYGSGEIIPQDVDYLERVLLNYLGDKKIFELDVIIQTKGGDANTSYLIAQLIRSYCENLYTLVPNYAYSGGTLISLSSNLIIIGRTGKLSPIDVQITSEGRKNKKETFALTSLKKYVEFIEATSKEFDFEDEKNKTTYVSPLIKQLVEKIHPITLGELFRLLSLAEYHSRILLRDYMFKNDSRKVYIVENIIQRLTSECPTHNFKIDYNIAHGLGLKVERMDESVYKASKKLINLCIETKQKGLICPYQDVENNYRQPFFEMFFPKKEGVKK